jgi:hypothetical protein
MFSGYKADYKSPWIATRFSNGLENTSQRQKVTNSHRSEIKLGEGCFKEKSIVGI